MMDPMEAGDHWARFNELPPGAKFVIIRQMNPEGGALRQYPTPETPWPFDALVEIDGAKSPLPRVQDRFIWSGTSWAAFELAAKAVTGSFQVSIQLHHSAPAKVAIQLVSNPPP